MSPLNATCLAVLLAALSSACATTRSAQPLGGGVVEIRRTETQRCWLVRVDGRSAGFLVLFADTDAPQDPSRRYFSVRNRDQQELGTLDALGRVYRFRPHVREAQWLGTATLAEGAARILDLEDDVELIELPLGAVRG